MKELAGPNKDVEKLCQVLKKVEKGGGSVNVLEDSSGEVRALTVSTAKIKGAYRGSNSRVIDFQS